MDNQAQDTKEQQLVFFSYIDKETGKVLAQDQASGQSGQPIEYQPDERLAALEKQGYTLAYNGFPQGARYSENDQMNQVFAILLKHKQKLVMDDKIQGNSQLPDSSKSYTLTISFVDEQGNELHPAVTQQSVWRCPVIIDEVTGAVISRKNDEWKPTQEQYEPVSVPVVKGYLADKSVLPSQPVVQQNINSMVVYQPLGKIVPITVNGQPVPNVASVQYQNDLDNASKVAVQSLPQVTGYTNNLRSLMPLDPLKDTKVLYEATTASKSVVSTSTSSQKPVNDKGSQEVYHYTVHFLNQDGEKVAEDNVQSSIWQSDGSRDIKNYQDVKAPLIKGYYTIDHRLKGPVAVPFELNHTVIYHRLGKIIPIDENGQEIAGASQPIYQNDPTDPTVPLANQSVPKLVGYSAKVTTITPDDAGLNTKVIYQKD